MIHRGRSPLPVLVSLVRCMWYGWMLRPTSFAIANTFSTGALPPFGGGIARGGYIAGI